MNSIDSFLKEPFPISQQWSIRRARYSVTIELRFFQNALTLGADALVLGRGRYDYIVKMYYFFAWTIFFTSYHSGGAVVQSIHLTAESLQYEIR